MESANGADSEEMGQPWQAKAIFWFEAEYTSWGAESFQVLYQIIPKPTGDLMM